MRAIAPLATTSEVANQCCRNKISFWKRSPSPTAHRTLNRKRLDDILADQFARFGATTGRSRTHAGHRQLQKSSQRHVRPPRRRRGYFAISAGILKRSCATSTSFARSAAKNSSSLLVETPTETALQIAERIRSLVSAPPGCDNELISVTVYLGVTDSRASDGLSRRRARPCRSRDVRSQARRPQQSARDLTRLFWTTGH